MKKFFVLFIIFGTSLVFAQDFTVNNYSVDIYINEKGYFDVVENYDLNFETHKHGIYRTIITEYNLLNAQGNSEKRKIKISNIKVPNYKFKTPYNFEQKLSNSLEIKIGDKNKTIIGPQQYQIKYRVHSAFLFEENSIQFYWNIKPNDWYADFKNVNFNIHIPKNITLNIENCFVYAGYTGNTTPSDEFLLKYEKNIFSGTSKDSFLSNRGQSVTVLLNLPKDAIEQLKPLWPFWNTYGWLSIIIVLIGGFYAVWKKFGKDNKVVSTTSFYPPENIDPAMAGFLINDKDDSSDIISLLPYWGAKGFLKIEEIPKSGIFSKSDTKLIKVKSLPETATTYEHKIFNGLFGVTDNDGYQLSSHGKTIDFISQIFGQEKVELKANEILVSSLKDSFYSTMTSARSILKNNAQLYYEAESKQVKTYTYIILVLMAILFGFIGLLFWGLMASFFIIATCVILIFINKYMIKKSTHGDMIYSELKGFKQFIKIAEENKLKILLKEDPGYFETTMGYALAFGMFKKWASKFDALNIPPPSWYGTSTGAHLSINNFSKSFSGVMSNVKSTMVSSPSSSSGSGSSGGGFSGGGFGGGGGGSW